MDLVPLKTTILRAPQFEQLSDVPPEDEWLANITNLKTRRADKEDVRELPPAPSSLSLPVFIKIRATSLLSLTSVA
jgi:hypothetical protein